MCNLSSVLRIASPCTQWTISPYSDLDTHIHRPTTSEIRITRYLVGYMCFWVCRSTGDIVLKGEGTHCRWCTWFWEVFITNHFIQVCLLNLYHIWCIYSPLFVPWSRRGDSKVLCHSISHVCYTHVNLTRITIVIWPTVPVHCIPH